jgi:peptide/nickel transport system permease protein
VLKGASRVQIPPSPLAPAFGGSLRFMGETMFPPWAPFFAPGRATVTDGSRVYGRVRSRPDGTGRAAGVAVSFVVRRLGSGVVVMALVSFVSWLVFASSLNPLEVFFPKFTSPPALAAAARGHLHDPLVVRYWFWLEGLFSGQGFGHMVADDTPIGPLVIPAFERTLELMVYALVLAVVLSVLVSALTTRRRGSVGDIGLRAVTYLAASVPAFLAALVIQGGFVAAAKAWHTNVLASSGPPTAGLGVSLHAVTDWFQHMTLPALAMALGLAGLYSRYLRSALLATLGEPYVQVARAKGLPERTVRLRHALRTALTPFVAAVAFDAGTVFGASLAADYVFRLNGLASVFLNRGLFAGDPNVIETEIVISAALVVCAGIVGDLVCARLDPRIRSG